MWTSLASAFRSSCVDSPESQCAAEGKHLDRSICIFCDVSKERGFSVIREDEHFVTFRDYNPSAKHHFLVIPKKHYESVKTLTRSDVDMVRRLVEIGHATLADHGVPKEQQRLGFHIPPYTSVDHLHLHAQGLPYRSSFRKLKYPIVPGSKDRDKGFSWFVSAEQTINILSKGRRVGISPC